MESVNKIHHTRILLLPQTQMEITGPLAEGCPLVNTFIRQKTDREVKRSIKVKKQTKKQRSLATVKSADTIVIELFI